MASDTSAKPMPPGRDAFVCTDRITPVDGDIFYEAGKEGRYTDVGPAAEGEIAEALRTRPWREVVAERFSQAAPWLYKIITSPARAAMLGRLNLKPDGRFLDVGAGWGQITIPLARVGNVWALDQTVGRLRVLREIARQEGVPVVLCCGDIFSFPFRENYFDLVVLNGVLEYLGLGRQGGDFAAHVEALSRVREILAPGGVAYLGIENRIGLKYLLGAPDDHTGLSHFTYRSDRADGTHARTWSLSEYRELAAQAGLVIERAYACMPDYKLIEAMIPLEEVDDHLASRGLPAPEHSGVDGTLLPTNELLDSLYRQLGRARIASHFVPSFGFVLRKGPAAACAQPASTHGDVSVRLIEALGERKAPADAQALTGASCLEGERLAVDVAQLQAQLRDAQRLLDEIQATRGWRMLMRWRALRDRFVRRRRGHNGRARAR